MEWFAQIKADFILNFIKDDRWRLLLHGLTNTLKITFFALIIGVAIGIVVASIRSTYDKNKDVLSLHKGIGYYILSVFNGICRIYLTVIRGTPIVVQLMIMYFIILQSVDNGVLVAIIAFGINSGAYVAEIVRGGIMSVDEGQFEAGRSLGFTYVQTMMYIIIPQVFKMILPTLCNEFIALLKETSVAGYVAVQDLTKAGDLIRSRTYSAFMPLIVVALIYLAMVMILTSLVSRLERSLRKNER